MVNKQRIKYCKEYFDVYLYNYAIIDDEINVEISTVTYI